MVSSGLAAGEAQVGQGRGDGVVVQQVQHEQSVDEHATTGEAQVGHPQPGEHGARPGVQGRRVEEARALQLGVLLARPLPSVFGDREWRVQMAESDRAMAEFAE
jgi:hypothetical protein